MTTAQDLDDRYGRRRARKGPWIVVGALAIVLVVVAAWITAARAAGTVDVDDLGFEVIDAHTVSLRFQVTTSPDREVYCAIEAQDEEYGVVGWKVIEVPSVGTHTRSLTERIPTIAEATTGLVNSCWVA